MPRSISRMTAVGVVVCLWTLHTVAFPHVAAHSFQHARHKATTHGSVLCTWLCTAGEISEVTAAATHDGQAPAAPMDPWLPSRPDAPSLIEPSSRAPPLLTL